MHKAACCDVLDLVFCDFFGCCTTKEPFGLLGLKVQKWCTLKMLVSTPRTIVSWDVPQTRGIVPCISLASLNPRQVPHLILEEGESKMRCDPTTGGISEKLSEHMGSVLRPIICGPNQHFFPKHVILLLCSKVVESRHLQ